MERRRCIFCDADDLSCIFDADMSVPVSMAMVVDGEPPVPRTPYNVLRCHRCGTHMTKYLPPLDAVYGRSHIQPIGRIRSEMESKLVDAVRANAAVSGILEIGGGDGSLASRLAGSYGDYTIVDAAYTGPEAGMRVVRAFVGAGDTDLAGLLGAANTVIMSHVFEHLYEPLRVLASLRDAPQVRFMYVCHPDLERYVAAGTANVLHVEHTFYVETQFLVDVFKAHGFRPMSRVDHGDYCIIMGFERCAVADAAVPRNVRATADVARYFRMLRDRVATINATVGEAPAYMWPCSVHSFVLLELGVDAGRLEGVLDNAATKIGKTVPGHADLRCMAFGDVVRAAVDGRRRIVVFANGGPFNAELPGTLDPRWVTFV